MLADGAITADFAIQIKSPLYSYISGSSVGPVSFIKSLIKASASNGYVTRERSCDARQSGRLKSSFTVIHFKKLTPFILRLYIAIISAL